MPNLELTNLADTLLNAWDNGQQLSAAPASNGLTLDAAYWVAAEIANQRSARGERPVGRKIGFTNRTIWEFYDVDAPMWSWMYDTTVSELPADGHVLLPNLAEPRIEPEVGFCFKSQPDADMSLEEIAATIDWMAPGFEVVTSPYPGWTFKLADCIAAQSLHGRYWYGPKCPMPADIRTLEAFSMRLAGPHGEMQGHATDVLDGPLHAVRFLLREIAKMPGASAIQPGEIVTTGTLTDAGPIAPDETWTARFDGIDLPQISITFAP